MNYIILDLEFNHPSKSQDEEQNKINKSFPFEIIQIGALKLDEKFNTLSTFDKLIKPEAYTDIKPHIQEITGLNSEILSTAKTFKELYVSLYNFLKGDNILCVWGAADIKELFRNITYHELNHSDISKKYIDIQYHASKHFKYPKGTNIGLSKAVDLLNIPVKEDFHNAFNDAFYTTEVFKKIYKKEIEPKVYNLNKISTNREPSKSTKLDTHKLLMQFEKMFNRELTKEEQSMIKLAYNMGKTSQFQVQKKESK
ncbi:3'-5' exonuclease [Clostridium sp. UBA4548]|uniref:3'-5' exonuclease n=1 Tax=Clostridium sp. UBA4548 TaxID=1946361 RepID=UPI0025BEB4DA|nr:3'-5' exonuclease [Clostridium sp. UBA4548]